MLWCLTAFLPILAKATSYNCKTELSDLSNWRNKVTEQLRAAVELKTNHLSELQYNCDLERNIKAGATSDNVLFAAFNDMKDIAASAGREMEKLLNYFILKVRC